MKLEADDYNLDDKIENYTLCLNEGKKMWRKNCEELSEEQYILGENNKIIINKKDSFYSHINSTLPSVKTKSIYHQFVKDKILEFSSLYPNLTKKDRYSLVLSEWKKVKNGAQ